MRIALGMDGARILVSGQIVFSAIQEDGFLEFREENVAPYRRMKSGG